MNGKALTKPIKYINIMKLLFDFFPIILFFVSYYQASFLIENTFIGQLIDPAKPDFIAATIVATGMAIIASFIQVAIHWFNTHKFERMHIFSLVLITVLGSITIFLVDNFYYSKCIRWNWFRFCKSSFNSVTYRYNPRT